jgi:uncharacterized protein (TIGR02302 family)
MIAPLPKPLQSKLRLQRWALQWEVVWAALHWPLLLLGLSLALLWSGILSRLPRPLPLVILALCGLVFLASLRALWQWRHVSDFAALRKLDSANALHHREASSLQDEPAPESAAGEVWEEHLRRKLAAVHNLNVTPPHSAWRLFDPVALRVPVALALVAAFFLGQGDLLSNVKNAASLAAPIPAKPIVLDAWLKPPSYTGKPPLLLTSPAMQEKLKPVSELSVPENSVLNLRLENAAAPHLETLVPGGDAALKLASSKTEKSETGFTADVKLDRPALVKVMDGDKELASYNFSVIPDAAPKIDFVEDPKPADLGQLAVKWRASDDYGLKSVSAEISLADEQESGTGFESNGVFLYEAPIFKIALKKPGAKQDEETSKADLASHPWAGLFVEMVLTAEDGAGHKASTAPRRFKLPERQFIRPLAQALVEQRKKIILAPEAAPDVATMLDALLLYPLDIRDNSGLIINLAALKARAANASSPDDVVVIVKDFWPLIMAVEDGHLNDLRAELKNLKDQLQQALREGAPQEKIDELMRRMREAMNQLMDQLQKEGEKRQAEGLDQQQGPALTPEELQKMLNNIGELNKQGSKDAAEQMLSQLDQLLQNLQPGGKSSSRNGSPGAKDQMDALSGLMGKQRKLMDETQRMGRDGKEPGGDGLGNRQKQLRDQLGKLGQGMGSEEGGDSLGEAGKNMDGAEQSLRGQQKDDALRQQNQALRKMLEGMGKLAEQMKKDGQGNQGANGQRGNGQDDPLGRPRATHDPAVGPNNNLVPSELAMKRAREILEELRTRANEEGLDEESKSYIDRLLKEKF